MKIYTETEMTKVIKAFKKKLADLGDPGCDGLPYYPEPIEVDLSAMPRQIPGLRTMEDASAPASGDLLD